MAKRFKHDGGDTAGGAAELAPSAQVAVDGPAASARQAAHFASAASATAASHRFSNLGATSEFQLPQGEVPVTSEPNDEAFAGSSFADETPRPIGVDPSVTGSFHVIDAQAGALLTTRETASERRHAAETAAAEAASDLAAGAARQEGAPAAVASLRSQRLAQGQGVRQRPKRAPRGMLVAIAVAALVVVALLLVLVRGVLFPAVSTDGASATTAAAAQAVALPEEGVVVRSYGYSAVLEGEAWQLVRSYGESSAVVGQFAGTPVAIALFEGMLYIPENLGDGSWDVICFMPADGSVMSQLVGDDGEAVTGSGVIASASLEGESLVLVDESGASTTLPLA